MTRVELAWGVAGAAWLARRCDVVVVCDVLSFSTAVSVAVTRDVTVWPHQWRDASAAARAAELGAVAAGPRGTGVSLSPPSLAALAPGTSLLLPSPNGAMCTLAAAEAGAAVVAGCLRNAAAVATWLRAGGWARVGLLAAGERWPDGSLRPAYEDWVGAGSIAARLAGVLCPDSEAAALGAAARRPLRETMSGAELVDKGFAQDVAVAEEEAADDVVPLLVAGAFRRA